MNEISGLWNEILGLEFGYLNLNKFSKLVPHTVRK